MTTESKLKSITVRAPINIALVKYWGKRFGTSTNVPLAGSLSLTLDPNKMATETTISFKLKGEDDIIILNNKKSIISGRALNVIEFCRNHAKLLSKSKSLSKTKCEEYEKYAEYSINVVSYNNFPTAAGLASSASGFAALALALHQLFDFGKTVAATTLARIGSGSASRSLFGGLVLWDNIIPGNGVETPSKEEINYSRLRFEELNHIVKSRSLSFEFDDDCYIAQLQEENNIGFCELIDVFVLVVSDKEKEVSSKGGMLKSAITSELLQHRAKKIVPRRLKTMSNLILLTSKDEVKEELKMQLEFSDFDCSSNDTEDNVGKIFEMTMRDSNQFHSSCVDTFPPIWYMNRISQRIIAYVHLFNETYSKITNKKQTYVAYTFDAGPNAVILTRKSISSIFYQFINKVFYVDDKTSDSAFNLPSSNSDSIVQTLINSAIDSKLITSNEIENNLLIKNNGNILNSIIETKAGSGASVI